MQSNGQKDYPKLGGCWLSRPIAGSKVFYINWCEDAPNPKKPDTTIVVTRRKSARTDNEGVAEVALAEFVSERSKPMQAKEDEMQIAIALKRYWDEYAKDLPSAYTAQWAINNIVDFFDTDTVEDLSELRQLDFIKHLRKLEYSDESINMCMSRIRAALKREHRLQRLKSVPFIIAIKDPVSKETPVIEGDGIKRMIEWSKSVPYLFRFLMLSCNTLSRPCALFDLKPSQCDFNSGLIHLNPNGRRQTKKYRPIVPMTETIKPYLQAWLLDTPADMTFINRDGGPILQMSSDSRFLRMMETLRIDGTPYSLRHTIATLLSRRGVEDSHIARMLGHSAPSVSKTTLRYLHHQPTYLKDVAIGIDAIMSEALAPSPAPKIQVPVEKDNVVSINRRGAA